MARFIPGNAGAGGAAAHAGSPSAGRIAFLAGGGEMGARIRAHHWDGTPLGPPAGWPPALKTALRIALTTRHPAFIFWGAAHLCLYNDAYRASLGPEKHPAILGMPGERAWPEIWHIIGPQITQVMAGGEASWHENQLVPMVRHGALRDVYWTYSYGPIHDETAPGGVGGVLVLCTETTTQVEAVRSTRESEAQLAQLFEQAPTFMALLEGPQHRIVRANPGYLRLAGHRPVTGRTVAEALPEAVEQGFLDLLDTVFRTGEPFIGAELRYVARDRHGAALEERFVTFAYQPLRDSTGAVTGIFVEGTDVTDAVRAREALRQSEAKYRGLFASLDAGFCIVETRGGTGGAPHDYKVIEANPAFFRQTGLAADMLGRWLREALPGLEDHWFETYGRVALSGEPARFVNQARQLDGRWYEVHAFRCGTPEDRQVGVLFDDITERRAAEERQALLSREVDHRAKNALAVVQAALRLTRAADHDSFVRAVEGRVAALARAQTLLSEDRWRGADLRTLLASELAAFLAAPGRGGPRADLAGPVVTLPAGAAQPIAMAVHELATNAVKYGALSVAGGHVAVTWELGGSVPPTLRLRWTESGGPTLEGPPARSGFGSRVLDATLRRQLGGSVRFDWPAEGLTCEIVVPLAAPAADDAQPDGLADVI
jgi:PAS domain S-box-containing protein